MPTLTRRGFLAVTSAVGAVAAGTPFEKYIHKLVQYVQPPAQTVPGEWVPYATTCRECPAGCGMLQMHRDGRVTKAEGNTEHPLNRGALRPRGQSSLQGQYDPDRLKSPLSRDRRSGSLSKISWQQAFQSMQDLLSVTLISRLETGTLDKVMKEPSPWAPSAFSSSSFSSSAAHSRPFLSPTLKVSSPRKNSRKIPHASTTVRRNSASREEGPAVTAVFSDARGIPLSGAAAALLGVTGWYGGGLSYRHRIGVVPSKNLDAGKGR